MIELLIEVVPLFIRWRKAIWWRGSIC